MTEQELADIKARWQWRKKARVVTVYGQSELFHQWVDHVADDETALLTEVDRLRAALHTIEAHAAAGLDASVDKRRRDSIGREIEMSWQHIQILEVVRHLDDDPAGPAENTESETRDGG